MRPIQVNQKQPSHYKKLQLVTNIVSRNIGMQNATQFERKAGQKKKIPSSLEEKFHSYDYEATTGENKTDPAKSSTMTKYSCHPP